MENIQLITAIVALVTALIGLPTIIIKFRKAYIEKKTKGQNAIFKKTTNSIKSGPKSVNTNISGKDNNNSNTQINIEGGVVINQKEKNNSVLEHKENGDDNIKLKNEYTSLFAEKGEVHSETIVIKNLPNGRVEGEVYLDERNTYKLTGTFRNRILTGEFTSIGQYTDERGTINLKLISEDILSGFCSFSKISAAEDQIRTSPYVWVAGRNREIINGTYDFCTDCHREGKKCCCATSDIDMPILLKNEALKLQAKNPKSHKMREFSNSIGNTPIRQIKKLSNSIVPVYCYFYDMNNNRCKIYDIRPTDCRLFPFDIKLDNETNEYWIGYYSDLCEKELPDNETMKQYAHILRPLLFLLFPYANTINKDDVCKKLKKASFERLYKLQEFIF